ncbi:glucose-6-phosphate isomerase [Arthrobacter roseus]|uniref:glucose-6-phosphate isomerase n=1 Tax=Arthrobacter roseus TaxID=136274 RepID=UPI001965163F|nr:glucose-6-phosphate isomerase [Arthrobacter roseus]MBM7848492.1 glucose-6-phosphate isomerase [Arthrobacter roseus]
MRSLSVQASGAGKDAINAYVPKLVEDSVASRIMAKDATLWGPETEPEASKRLDWVDLARSSRPLVQEIIDLRESFAVEGVDRFVLAGMGGSSLAPELITSTVGVPLTVLDSTDPEQVHAALEGGLQRTAMIVSSKSGSTLETDSQLRIFAEAFADAGIAAPSRIVVVTDAGSALDNQAREDGYRRVFNANPNVGGRYSALTAFGLVPSGLAGADLGQLLDDAEEAARILAEDSAENMGLRLGAALGGTNPLRDKIVIVDESSGLNGFASWAEQLIAESTGKAGTGLLPVVAEHGAPETLDPDHDIQLVRLISPEAEAAPNGAEVWVAGSLGGQLLLWEFATVVAGRILGINPFDQPDVEAAKKAARGLLDQEPQPSPAVATFGDIEVRGTEDITHDPQSLDAALESLFSTLGPDGYLSIQAYLNREADHLGPIRSQLSRVTGRPVTFGWGPRFLHSTGQFHKGGPSVGVFLQITAETTSDLKIPGREFSFGDLIAAQAAGDAQVLAEHDRPVLRLHLLDRSRGLAQLQSAVTRISDVRK